MQGDNGNLTGRCALVTGGTDGIGKEIARGLAARGARVFIASSDPQKGKRVECELRQEASHTEVHFIRADLSLVREVDRFAEDFLTRCDSLHYLVLCAGIVRGWFTLTSEGVETNFAIGYISRFVLVERLLPIMQKRCMPGSAAARILLISGAARKGTIHYDDVNLTHNFATLRAVLQLCEANDVFAIEQARRLTEADETRVQINVLKVGVVRTGIRRQFPTWMRVIVPLLFDWFLSMTPQRVAWEALRLLLSPEFENTSGGHCFCSSNDSSRCRPERGRAIRQKDAVYGRPANGWQIWVAPRLDRFCHFVKFYFRHEWCLFAPL
jgi:NAD(P)-dependent dehydrogenase (short-subunit alcohol dehydrogenase family)